MVKPQVTLVRLCEMDVAGGLVIHDLQRLVGGDVARTYSVTQS